ncbi:sporozoite surface protein 2-like [Crassostrea angulata]|uniref:sporozoite surface protein 2-like n=1 Tax=Magallana angulata TaxID=2784310 RepID=UPI0022B141EA|nr:sporozoite surface protein 2-like [Crassostrea angulata]
MLKFGVLVLLPFVLGGAPHGSGYASNRANNRGNRPGPAINMGSSGNNRMSITNFGPLPNKPNNNLNPIHRQMPSSPRYSSQVPYQCTMYSDAGYFCPYRYEQPSTRYFFNVYSGRCESFYYLGCGGNLNNYGSREDCLSSCACFIYPDHGNYYCPYGGSTRWYFDKYSGTCQSFYYSGCNGGNDNNFESQLECQSTCAPRSSCYGPYCMYPYNIMPAANADTNVAMNSGAQSNANLVGPVRPNSLQTNLPNIPNASKPNIPNTPVPNRPNALLPNSPNAPMPYSPNSPMPNNPNVPMPNSPNAPMPNINMPNIPNAPMPEPNFQGVNGINMHGSLGNEANTNGLNNENNGFNFNSVAQIWKMATNAVNADAPPNRANMIYPSGPNQMTSGLTMY